MEEPSGMTGSRKGFERMEIQVIMGSPVQVELGEGKGSGDLA